MTAVTKQSDEMVSDGVKDDRALLGPSQGEIREVWPPQCRAGREQAGWGGVRNTWVGTHRPLHSVTSATETQPMVSAVEGASPPESALAPACGPRAP